jgi:hypothetical protein
VLGVKSWSGASITLRVEKARVVCDAYERRNANVARSAPDTVTFERVPPDGTCSRDNDGGKPTHATDAAEEEVEEARDAQVYGHQ